jgi:hypothetical protein
MPTRSGFAAPLIIALTLGLLATPSHAQTVAFTENFDEYSVGALPDPPWFNYTVPTAPPVNTSVTTAEAASPPNSATVGQGGNSSSAARSMGASSTTATLALDLWPTDPSCSNCGWQTTNFGFTNSGAANIFPDVLFGAQNSPPSGQVNIQVSDCFGNPIGNTNIAAGVWHLMVLAARCEGLSSDFVTLHIDGSLVTLAASAPAATTITGMVFDGAIVGGSPVAEGFIDNITLSYGGPGAASPARVMVVQGLKSKARVYRNGK